MTARLDSTRAPSPDPAAVSATVPSGLHRCVCGDPELSAIDPGHEEKAFGNNLFTHERGAPLRGWCVRCRPDLRAAQAARAAQRNRAGRSPAVSQ